MTRQELINKVNVCGSIDFPSMIYLIENLDFQNETIRLLLLERVSQNGKLSKEDLITLSKNISYTAGSPINEDSIADWLSKKCSFSQQEWKVFLDYIQFVDGSTPTYLLTETNDIIIGE